jgi:hypothetical protein
MMQRYINILQHKKSDGIISENNQKLIDTISSDSGQVEVMFKNSIFVVVPYIAIFYSLLLFDVLGDSEGWKKAIWAPILVICVPVLFFFVTSVYKLSTSVLSSNKSAVTETTEMVDLKCSKTSNVTMNPLVSESSVTDAVL